MTLLPLDGLDISMLVLTHAPFSEIELVAVQHVMSGENVDEDFWHSITVAAKQTSGNSWPCVRTIARRGVRPTGPRRVGALTVNDSLFNAAADAVETCLRTTGAEVPPPDDVVLAWLSETAAEAQAFAGRLDDQKVWSRTSLVVDGRSFALWKHLSPTGFAACADLGFAVVSIAGVTEPDVWDFTLLTPDQVVAAFS